MTREEFIVEEIEDTDEICLHCGSLIDSNYRICPVCGQVWYVREEQRDADSVGKVRQ